MPITGIPFGAQLPDEFLAFDAMTASEYIVLRTKSSTQTYSQYLDQGTGNFNTFARKIEELLHSLHGGDAEGVLKRRKCLRNLLQSQELQPWERGFLTHAFGDSFAHTYTEQTDSLHSTTRAYPTPLGHGLDSILNMAGVANLDPDLISNFPGRYRAYVTALFNTLKLPNNDPSLLNAILENTGNLPASHDEANSYMGLFVDAYFQYGETGHGDYRPETGKQYFQNSADFQIPSAQALDKLFDRIRKSCCDTK